MYVIITSETRGRKTYYHLESAKKPYLTTEISHADKFSCKEEVLSKIKTLNKQFPKRSYTLKQIPNLNDII